MDIRVLTWNVENLFQRTADDSKAAHRAYELKLSLLAEMLMLLRADVVALQEVGSPEALQDLQRALRGTYPESACSDHPDHRGIRVAFLSKLRVTGVQQIWRHPLSTRCGLRQVSDGAPTAMRRGALRVQVQAGRKQLSIVNAHLKSKLLTYPTAEGNRAFSTTDEELRARVASLALAERTAEAVTLRSVATTALQDAPDEPFILLGDLNDVPLAATTEILLGPPGSQPGSRSFDLPDAGDASRLFNLANLIEPERRYSRINNGVPELIDQILVSQHFMPLHSLKRRLRPEVDSHVDFVSKLPSIGNNPHERVHEAVPDHAPVSAKFHSVVFD